MVDVRYTEQLHIELLDGDGLFLVNAVNLAFCAAAVYERGSPSDSEWNPVQDRLWQVFFKKISHKSAKSFYWRFRIIICIINN